MNVLLAALAAVSFWQVMAAASILPDGLVEERSGDLEMARAILSGDTDLQVRSSKDTRAKSNIFFCVIGLYSYSRDVSKAVHNVGRALRSSRQVDAELAACSDLDSGADIADCVDKARRDYEERWAEDKIKLLSSTVDVTLGLVVTYFDCNNLFA